MIYTNRISPLAPLYRRSDSAPEEDTIAGAPPCPSLFGAEGRDQDFALPIAGFIRSVGLSNILYSERFKESSKFFFRGEPGKGAHR